MKKRLLSKILGGFLVGGIIIGSVTGYAQATDIFNNLTLQYSTKTNYSYYFSTDKSSTAPYVKYAGVYTEGNYYVGSEYYTSASGTVSLGSTKIKNGFFDL